MMLFVLYVALTEDDFNFKAKQKIIVAIINHSVMRILKNSDEANYNMMIDNIITGSKMYYEECKYGDIKNSDGSKKICSSSVDLTLRDLVK